jgi:MFS family permease
MSMYRWISLRASAARWLWRADQLSVQDRNIRYLVIDTAWQGLMMGGAYTFISVFVVRLGASSLMVSLLTSLPAILMVLFSLPAAQVVQRQRDLVRFTNIVRIFHRGAILLIALLPFVIREHLMEAAVGIWVLNTIALAFLDSAWTVVVADIIPARRRASVNGGRWALLSLVTALSVAVYGVVLDHSPFPLGYQIVFFVSFLGGVIGMYYYGRIEVSSTAPEPASVVGGGTLQQRLNRYVRTFRGAPPFVRYVLTTFVLRFGLSLPAALYSIYWIRQLDASDLWIGWQATAGKLALIVGYYLWGRAAMRRGHHLVLVACTVGVGLYPVVTGIVPSQFWLPLAAVVQGFFITGIDLSFFDTLLHVCPADRRPSFIAVNSMFANLAMTIAPLVGSALAGWIGIRTVFWIGGAIHVVAAVLFRISQVAVEEEEA